ncbi:DUF2726 domain-containing protein [Acinetobacter sp. Ver3]|uniref:DUF2726 domain-containing protein n=1 Tax=Acinetobacter sp. Ver3 TaxID=466088 RepID=UPI000449CFD6|nr:DUF2726 domain-containing protein [Acinetobacter sp. Ver3]EZQ03775.1 hypothetical protein CL42_11085 [Acinetobacter sp. Ver3]
MDIMIIASVIILAVVLFIAYKGLKHQQPSDSMLRQRAVFSPYQQVTFNRLKEIMPNAHILAHVSFDALLTTKLPRTRRKYESMFADFVVMNKDCKVLAIVSLEDKFSFKRGHTLQFQNALLETAGYKVISYHAVPEYVQLRRDFLDEYTEEMPIEWVDESVIEHKLEKYSAGRLADIRAFS